MINSIDQHAAKSVFFSWIQFKERAYNEIRLNHHMRMISKHIIVKSKDFIQKGKEDYQLSLIRNNKEKILHEVIRIETTTNNSKEIDLEADIGYLRICSNGKREGFKIQYFMKLIKGKSLLPKFSKIEFVLQEEFNQSIKDSYSMIRVKSLLFYWLALMESLKGNVNPFKELLVDGFILNYGTSSRITTLLELEIWIGEMKLSLISSHHYPENIRLKETSLNEFQLSIDLYWEGISKDGRKLKARTNNTWYIVDNLNYRFPKILRMNVTQVDS